MSKKSRFRGPFDKERGKRAVTLLKCDWEYLYHIYWTLWTEFSWKKSPLVICKVLGLFVNTLTADYKYSLLNRGYLLRHVQMQLSQKRKTFSNFFIYLFIFFTFSEFKLNLEHNQKKEDPHSWCIFELRDPEKRG